MNLPSFRDNPVFYLGLAVTIEQAIAGGTVHLTNVIPETWIPYATAWAALLAFIGTSIMTALSAPGVLKPATVAKAAGAAVLAVVLFAPADARAQTPRPRPQIDLPDPLHLHDKDTTPSGGTQGTDKLASILAKPFNDLADFINSDTAAAAALAVQIPDLQDGHGQACWMAMGQFTSVLHAHPIPVTLHAATDLEAFRLAAMAANNLCHNASCNQIFTDLANSIQKAAPVNLGIPIPSLSSLCAYVPQVTVVPGVPQPPVPAVMPPTANPNPNP